jgi:LmbE family N-acetylglucosaminyl deacetylase
VNFSRAAANDAILKSLRSRPVVVLSPHFDDACLSLGGLLCALGRGTLVNIFTRSLHLARSAIGKPDENHVRAVRDAEDRAFAEHSGLVRHDLQCHEPGIVGRTPFDLTHLDDDIAQASAPLLQKLVEIAASGERSFLFCPLGVGRHVNHRATIEIVLNNLDRIRETYEVLFYEEQPYAAHLVERLVALRRLRRRLPGASLVRNAYVPDWPGKRALIGLYPSQFPEPVRANRLRPFAMRPLRPHEAFWSMDVPGKA